MVCNPDYLEQENIFKKNCKNGIVDKNVKNEKIGQNCPKWMK